MPLTTIQSPTETAGWDERFPTPCQSVFFTIQSLLEMVERGDDLNKDREQIMVMLDRALSWESELRDLEPHIYQYAAANHRKGARYL